MLSQMGVDPTLPKEDLGGNQLTEEPQVNKEIKNVLDGESDVKNIVSGLDNNDYKEIGSDIFKTSVGVGGAYALSQGDKIAEKTKMFASKVNKASRYISSASKLNSKQVDEFLNSKSVKNTMKHLDKLNAKLKDPDLEKTMRAGNKPPETYESVKKQINKIKNNQAKYWANKFGVNEEDIGRLYKTGNRKKWNVFKLKKNLTKKYPKTVGKLGSKYIVGSLITDISGVETEGFKRIGIDIAAGYATEKAVTNKFLPQLTKMLTSEKGRRYLTKVIGKQAAKKIVTSAAAGGGTPLSIATALIGSGLAAYDIYNLVKEYNED